MNASREVRSRLQRRLFLWFGATILVTSLTVAGVMSLLSPGPPWKQEIGPIRTFLGSRFGVVWDKVSERDELARTMADQLGTDVRIMSLDGATLATFGKNPCDRAQVQVPVARGGVPLGVVEVCWQPLHRTSFPLRLVTGLLITGGMLWLASSAIAHRISRPVAELTRVAQDIGQGRLTSRIQLGRYHRGEEAILANVMNDMAERIERQMADQRALLATVSHEIRTPLARIRLLTEMARGENDATLEKIDDEVIEIDGLVAELLASSRLDFSAMTPKDLDPEEMVTRALERASIGKLPILNDGDGRTFQGDPTLVNRALLNLLENARRHAGGAVACRIRTRPGFVAFEVEDEGPGVTPGDEDKIFQPFFRRTEDARSVGLGLSLVRRIAEAHGGTAYVVNRETKGAIFGVEFSSESRQSALPGEGARS